MREGLTDTKVIEIGTTVVAPYATQSLGALGADVIKVEAPGGDPFREASLETEAGVSGYFAMCNCEKKSISVDLKTEKGREILLELVAESDVVVENLSPGTADRLGIGYEDAHEITSDIIYCSISGYGQDGPWHKRPAFDPILQGATGLMSVTGEKDGSPVRIGVAVVDLMTATWSVIAILNALRDRDHTGEGTYIDMSMFDVGLSMLTKKATQYMITGENPQRMGTHDQWAAPYGAFPTKDDRQLIIGTPFQNLWEKLCQKVGEEQLIEDDRFVTNRKRVQNREDLHAILTGIIEQKTLEEWLNILQSEIPVGPILTVEEALTNEQTEYNNIKKHFEEGLDVLNLPLRMDGERQEFETRPPKISEHANEILHEIGLSAEEIEQLNADDVIIPPRSSW